MAVEESKARGPQLQHAEALAAAERLCRQLGVRLTPQRRRVLEILLDEPGAVGAYDIADRLATGGPRPAPIAVYRSLDFLVAQGLAHKLASINAFIACAHPGHDHQRRHQFLICSSCRLVQELDDAQIQAAVRAALEGAGFAPAEPVVELVGTCRTCAD